MQRERDEHAATRALLEATQRKLDVTTAALADSANDFSQKSQTFEAAFALHPSIALFASAGSERCQTCRDCCRRFERLARRVEEERAAAMVHQQRAVQLELLQQGHNAQIAQYQRQIAQLNETVGGMARAHQLSAADAELRLQQQQYVRAGRK